MTIFLTTHRLEEAERLCDRVAILNTHAADDRPARGAPRPAVRQGAHGQHARAAAGPGPRLRRPPAVDGWRQDGAAGYVLTVSDPAVAAPAVTRALVAAGADVLSIAESHHSLEDVYLELVDEDGEVAADEDQPAAGVRAIVRKELREYRRNGSIVAAMAIIPLIFLVQPLIVVFALSSTAAQPAASQRHELLYMLGIPALVPAMLAAYAVVGERQQGTLEPVLTTPIRREEFLLGKALAALVPSVAIAYAVFGLPRPRRALRSRPASRRPSSGPGCARPGHLHAAHRRLVDLGRHRDLDPRRATSASPSSSACSRACRRRGDHAHRVRRDPRHAAPCPRLRSRAARRQPARLAGRLGLFDRERLIIGTR